MIKVQFFPKLGGGVWNLEKVDETKMKLPVPLNDKNYYVLRNAGFARST